MAIVFKPAKHMTAFDAVRDIELLGLEIFDRVLFLVPMTDAARWFEAGYDDTAKELLGDFDEYLAWVVNEGYLDFEEQDIDRLREATGDECKQAMASLDAFLRSYGVEFEEC